ncbi:MAG: hypothetical protein JEY99_19655 [Spirochaetales bacterium]|nr:hypothetical protein [Spirochaetales bacterium]
MIGFLMKKSFFDGWDNLISIILINLGFILCLAAIFFLPGFGENLLGSASIFLVIPGILLIHVYAGAVSALIKEASDFQSFELKKVVVGFKANWKVSLLLGVVNSLIFMVIIIAFPFYLSFGNMLGVAGAGFIFWVSFFWIVSIQYFFPVYTRLEGSFIKSIKKCFLISLDNPGFSIFSLLYSAILFVISLITAFMIPGIGGILLFQQNAIKLRIYKYDWLEENPDGDRKKIPWDSLLFEDRERIGPRSIKGMIFPWKD